MGSTPHSPEAPDSALSLRKQAHTSPGRVGDGGSSAAKLRRVSQAGKALAETAPSLTDFVQSREQYEALYRRSIEEPTQFWAEVASGFHWQQQWDEDHHHYNFDVRDGPINIEWFKGGTTNMCYNALDGHVQAGHGEQPCFLFEPNKPGPGRQWSYQQVLDEVCRLGNWLRAAGVHKGDAVAIYMPMVCELPIAMLACARIGAIHSVVFGGFAAEALAGRIEDCQARVLLTASTVMRGAKCIPLKPICDQAMHLCSDLEHTVTHCLVYENDQDAAADTHMVEGRDHSWQQEVPAQPAVCPVEWVESEHPLFLLYTSGSTGKPKGVLHTTGGYMVYVATTCRHVFQLQPGDVYFCSADCGWITGHSYLTYGPLLNRAQTVVFEGVPIYPTPARFWEIIDKYQVKQFYTSPTAVRSLMQFGDQWLSNTTRASLQVLGTVGEPINPEAWRWYHQVVGDSRCPIVDTWWQTETAGHMITPLPGAWAEKPGSATLPFFGVDLVIVDENGQELHGACQGLLLIRSPWPGIVRTIYADHARYQDNYFGAFPGYYFTGDGARRDVDGYYWILGRVDDVIQVAASPWVAGNRIGTAEVESALVAHPACAEAAVVGCTHATKGQGIYAFVVVKEGVEVSDALRKDLMSSVCKHIGAFAAPDVIHWAPGLPKTRSGKIMRRVLRKIANKQEEQLGDMSTLADPSIVQQLLDTRGK